MASSINPLGSSSDPTSSSSNSTASTGTDYTQTFLTLLVAQLQNQDPMNPTDSTQFVSQLAQFSELEQVMGIKQDIESYHAAAAAASSTNNGTTNNGTTPTSS